MTEFFTNPFAIGAASLLLAALLTYLVRLLAHRYGFVAKPKSDRWHQKPTAMLGGAAVFLSTLLMYAAFVPKTKESLIVIAGGTLLFLVGLIDDILNIKPYQKLVGQLFGAIVVVGFGLKLPLTGFELIDIFITVFWLIGITNAINLLDNMDGLAAGISAIAAGALAFSFGANGQINELLFVAVFVGSLLGFLVFNFNPASIFMGDCGSMFVGFLLSASVLMNQTGGRSRSVVTVLAVPALILFVPIFDTTFVTILRKIWGRKASQGGRDHTSHRLVALGLTERNAVLMLYLFAAGAGLLSILIGRLDTVQSLALICVFTIALTFIGVYLSKVKVYDKKQEDIALQNNAVFAFLVDVSYKRRIFEVFLDTFLITLSYYTAYVLLYGSFENSPNWELFLRTLPILIIFKLFAFLVAGVYRGLWRYTSIGDFITFTKGVVLGSGLSIIAILLLYRFQNFSRTVFVLDGAILLVALIVSRMAFRIFRQMLPPGAQRDGSKVLIYGAGDGGEMVLRELKNNPEWNYSPIGFIDDDPMKKGRVIHGLRVFDGNGSLPEICESREIEEILISIREIDPAKLKRIKRMCRELNISIKTAQIKIEPFDLE